jgi:hypothetical protein
MNRFIAESLIFILLALGFPLMATADVSTKLSLLKEAGIQLDSNPEDSKAWATINMLGKDSDPLVRTQTVYTVGSTYGKNAPKLKDAKNLEEKAWPFILNGFKDDESVVRQAAYQWAGAFKNQVEISLPYLIRGLNEDGSPGSYAADTIGGLGPQAKPAIPALLNQIIGGPKFKGGSIGQVSVANALGKLGPNAIEAVPGMETIARKFSDDPEFLFLIVKNLHKIDQTNALALQLLGDFEKGKYGSFFASRAKSLLAK